MRNLHIYLSAIATLSPYSSLAIRHSASQLRDLFAYPKYEIQFLNDLPLASSDAHRCQNSGLENEEEFLDLRISSLDRKRVGDGSEGDLAQEKLDLVTMHLTPPGTDEQSKFLCLMPSKNSTDSQLYLEDEGEVVDELDPAVGWDALSHLDGRCLYSRQGWFTYSYCHNSHIRQFRAAPHAHPHPPGGFEPTEDTTYDAYTLGQSQASPLSPPTTLTNQPRLPPKHDPNTSTDSKTNPYQPTIAHSPTTRYLTQRYTDGTPCDKTRKPREVEVQFHCSMTTNDQIYMIKEMAICSYVLIIHTPRLCGLPGFRNLEKEVEGAKVKCRRVVGDGEVEEWVEKGRKGNERVGRGMLGVEDGKGKIDGMGGEKGFGGLQVVSGMPGIAGVPQVQLLEGMSQGELKAMLQQAMAALGNNRPKAEGVIQQGAAPEGADPAGEGEVEEVFLVSWEEGEDGAVLLNADVLGGEGEEGGVLAGDEKEAILKAVREYLEGRGDAGNVEVVNLDDVDDQPHYRDEL